VLHTSRDWEQHRSHPDGALRAHLMVIARAPKAVEKALKPLPDGARESRRDDSEG
jgi:hypothetical protein